MSFVTAAASASIETITFDNLPSQNGSTYTAVQNGYAGLNWDQLSVVDTALQTTNHGVSGYTNSVVSANNVAFNIWGTPATISAMSSSGFTLYSGYFTAGWNNGLNVQAVATFENGTSATNSFILNTSSRSNIQFNWNHLASVTFTSSGGTNPGYVGSGTQFAFDNLTVDPVAAVPVPSAIWLFSTALAGLGFVGKGRAKKSI